MHRMDQSKAGNSLYATRASFICVLVVKICKKNHSIYTWLFDWTFIDCAGEYDDNFLKFYIEPALSTMLEFLRPVYINFHQRKLCKQKEHFTSSFRLIERILVFFFYLILFFGVFYFAFSSQFYFTIKIYFKRVRIVTPHPLYTNVSLINVHLLIKC